MGHQLKYWKYFLIAYHLFNMLHSVKLTACEYLSVFTISGSLWRTYTVI